MLNKTVFCSVVELVGLLDSKDSNKKSCIRSKTIIFSSIRHLGQMPTPHSLNVETALSLCLWTFELIFMNSKKQTCGSFQEVATECVWQMDILLCPACEQKFSPILRRPLILSCGHTLCQLCIEGHREHCENGDQDVVSENTVILQMLGEGVETGEAGEFAMPPSTEFHSVQCCKRCDHPFVTSETFESTLNFTGKKTSLHSERSSPKAV